MAFSTTPVDLNRGSNSMALPPELARDIWAQTYKSSAVMQLAQRVDLPGRGAAIPVLAGLPEAGFVVESTEKPVSTGTPALKYMYPYKIAVIVPMSKEFARDLDGMYEEIRRVLPVSLGMKFDDAVFNGPTPGSGFDTLAANGFTSVNIAADGTGNTYQKLVAAAAGIAYRSHASVNGIAIDAYGKGVLMSAVDGTGHPLFADAANGQLGQIIGARVAESPIEIAATDGDGNECFGWIGDWNKARYGLVNDIEISVSDQATLNDGNGGLIHLWQRNMLALRAECEIGFVVSDANAFTAIYAATESE